MQLLQKPRPKNLWMPWLAIFVLTAAFFGGNWPLWQALLPGLLAGWGALTWAFFSTPVPKPLKYGVLVPLCVVLGVGLMQTMPLLGLTNPIYTLVKPEFWPAVSMNLPATVEQLAYAVGLLLVGMGVFALTRRNLESALPVRAMALAILAVGVYGLVVYIGGNHSVMWLAKRYYPDSLTATFINHSHYATFAGIGVLCCLAMFLERVGEVSSRLKTRQRVAALWLLVVQPRWPWLLGAVLLFVTVVLSTSRAGVAATGLGIAALLVCLGFAKRSLMPYLLGLMGAGVVLGVLLINVAGASLVYRLEQVENDAPLRGMIYDVTRAAIAEHPLAGQGFGAFADIFLMQRGMPHTMEIAGAIDHAHNTYLELGAELGLPALMLVGVAGFMTLAFLLQGLGERRRGVTWPALGVAVMFLTGSHALADFSLSMPAVALATVGVVAFCLAQSYPGAETEEPGKPPERQAARGALPLLALVIIPFSLWQTWAEYPATRATGAVTQLERGEKPQHLKEELAQAWSYLAVAVQRNPYHAGYLYNLGRVETALAQTKPEGAAQVMETQARQHLAMALQLQPALSGAWYRLAWLETNRRNDKAAQNMLANSLLTCGFDLKFLLARAPLMLTLYPHATPENQTLFTRHLRYLWQERTRQLWNSVKNSPQLSGQLRQILAAYPQYAEEWKKVTKTPLTAPEAENGAQPAEAAAAPQAKAEPKAGGLREKQEKKGRIANKKPAR